MKIGRMNPTPQKPTLNVATTTPPLNFPKQWITFSNSKQDVCCKFILYMDVQYELVRWERNALFGLESDSVSVFLLTFSSDQEKVKSLQGRNTKQWNIKQTGRAQTSYNLTN